MKNKKEKKRKIKTNKKDFLYTTRSLRLILA